MAALYTAAENNKIDVLDKGYIRLVSYMGDDLTVVNTARVSFDKESTWQVIDGQPVLDEKDSKLIAYLVKNKHDSCLRHCSLTFEVYAPLMVGRQWWKHGVASAHWEDQFGWNESSRRYVTENEEFYVPDHFLAAPDNKKQGAGKEIDFEKNATYRTLLVEEQQRALSFYETAIDQGMAPEQARLFLPAYGMYIRWRWTTSLNAALNFLSLRLDEHAQSEIRLYAAAVEQLIEPIYPVTCGAWRSYR